MHEAVCTRCFPSICEKNPQVGFEPPAILVHWVQSILYITSAGREKSFIYHPTQEFHQSINGSRIIDVISVVLSTPVGIADMVKSILDLDASINFYMFHGEIQTSVSWTELIFWTVEGQTYAADITSYGKISST